MTGIVRYEKPILFSLSTHSNVASGDEPCRNGFYAACLTYDDQWDCAGGSGVNSIYPCRSGGAAKYDCSAGAVVGAANKQTGCCNAGSSPGTCNVGGTYNGT